MPSEVPRNWLKWETFECPVSGTHLQPGRERDSRVTVITWPMDYSLAGSASPTRGRSLSRC